MIQETVRLVYTVKEVQEILGAGKSLVYEGLRQKIIPSLKIGRRYFIPKEGFQRWLNEGGLLKLTIQ